MRKPRTIPFEVWSVGANGDILACVDCFGACNRGERRWVPVYKTPWFALRHGERFGHRIEPVAWFAAHPYYTAADFEIVTIKTFYAEAI